MIRPFTRTLCSLPDAHTRRLLVTPDCSYLNASGHRVIPTKRDLEDYARLWVSGVSNTLSLLPSGSTVTLNWGDVGSPDTNNPTIDLFTAADTNGGIGYLTNETIATQQTNITLCPYIGRLGPGGSIQLNASTFSNNWAGDYYIWCGSQYGSGTLTLTIADGSGNVLAQSSQYIQIWILSRCMSVGPWGTLRRTRSESSNP